MSIAAEIKAIKDRTDYVKGYHGEVYIKEDEVIKVVNHFVENAKEKVVIPQVIADWLEEHKKTHSLFGSMIQLNGIVLTSEVTNWFHVDKTSRSETFARAWLDGYEIEKEKLYTVEIPDPHGSCGYRYLRKSSHGVTIGTSDNDLWKSMRECQLTEEAIKEDFEWAWNAGFAEEVK